MDERFQQTVARWIRGYNGGPEATTEYVAGAQLTRGNSRRGVDERLQQTHSGPELDRTLEAREAQRNGPQKRTRHMPPHALVGRCFKPRPERLVLEDQ